METETNFCEESRKYKDSNSATRFDRFYRDKRDGGTILSSIFLLANQNLHLLAQSREASLVLASCKTLGLVGSEA